MGRSGGIQLPPQLQSSLDELSDLELVAACRAGTAAAWEQLVRRYQRLIYTIPLRHGLAEDEAADVFQQTCQRLVERLDTLYDASRLDAWLVSTARRLSLDALARRRREARIDATMLTAEGVDDTLPEHSLLLLEEQLRIRRAVERLDARCRALLYHLFYDSTEPSYTRIAATLGMARGSIGPVRSRCFARLRMLLQEE